MAVSIAQIEISRKKIRCEYDMEENHMELSVCGTTHRFDLQGGFDA
jgi:hypothetical protein